MSLVEHQIWHRAMKAVHYIPIYMFKYVVEGFSLIRGNNIFTVIYWIFSGGNSTMSLTETQILTI